MQHFERDFARPEHAGAARSSSSRTTARTATSSTPPTRSSSTTRRGSARTCGRATTRASRCARSRRPRTIDEAAFIVDVAKGLAADGLALSEVAVLYRSNAQSRVLEHALFNAAIPYRVYGGMRFFERAEVKHALAYLRLVAAPDDDGAFLRIVNFPPRGIGARTLETLPDAARAQGTSLWQAACAGGRSGGKADASLAAFVAADRSACAPRPPACRCPRRSQHVNAASGLVAHYRDGEGRAGPARQSRGARQRRRAASCAKPISRSTRRCRRRATDARRRGDGRAPRSADRVPRACRARSRRDAGGRGPAGAAAHDGARGEGARVPHGVRHRARGRTLSAREQPATNSTASRRSGA